MEEVKQKLWGVYGNNKTSPIFYTISNVCSLFIKQETRVITHARTLTNVTGQIIFNKVICIDNSSSIFSSISIHLS